MKTITRIESFIWFVEAWMFSLIAAYIWYCNELRANLFMQRERKYKKKIVKRETKHRIV